MYVFYGREQILFITSTLPEPESRPYIEVPDWHSAVHEPSKWMVRDGELVERSGLLDAKALRVAVVSDYGINCGIATYTKYLCDALAPQVGSLRIYAEDKTVVGDDPENVVRCWDRKGDYARILPEMEKFNPDVIFVQHEYGLFHKIDAWCQLMSQLSRWRVVTVLHTVLEHRVADQETSLDYQCRALAEAACPEVIVHSPKARDCMRDRGYSGLIHLIPHGCFEPSLEPTLPTDKYEMRGKHTIFQYGFGGKHKGWEFAIETIGLLKSKYPDIAYTGVFNLSPFGGSEQTQYHHQLLDLIREKGLENNIAILRGYQSEKMLSNFLRGSRVAFFPYQVPNPHWASWGASGAVQLPISHGLPMVLSDFPCFQEFDGIFPLCKTTAEAAATISRIFDDPAYELSLQLASKQVSAKRAWPNVAKAYLSCTPREEYTFG